MTMSDDWNDHVVDPIHAPTTEKDWQAQVIEMAQWGGWLVYHTFDSRRSQAGFPDLVLVHHEAGIIFAELKRERGQVSIAQREWLDWLEEAGRVGVDVYVWRPSEIDEVARVLLGGLGG